MVEHHNGAIGTILEGIEHPSHTTVSFLVRLEDTTTINE